ncbi:MAG: hypothetical protein NZ772_00665 [Cyanobacteria bacterium]|nr:hypothetical protein [Cyanobacteriota bacterium]MDW8199884.1 hypothetical protein [Cyanobacteriota bacterium SKYGB_h_bin112]
MEEPHPTTPKSPVTSSPSSVAETWHQLILAARHQLASWLRYVVQRLQQFTDRVAPPDLSSSPEAILPLAPAFKVWVISCWQWSQQRLLAWIPNRWLRDRSRLSMVAGGIVLTIGIMLLLTSQPPDTSSPGDSSILDSPTLAPSPVPATPLQVPPAPAVTSSPEPTNPSPALPSPPNSPSPSNSPLPSSQPPSSPLSNSSTTLVPLSPPAAIAKAPSLDAAQAPGSTLSDSEEPWIAVVPAMSLEQQLQGQLTAALDPYGPSLVQGITPDYPRSRLTVHISHEWYSLNPDQQDDAAANLYHQVMALNINHLDLVDDQGCTIARSPVVGDRMVILKRRP